MTSLMHLDAVEQARLVRSGEVSAQELVLAAIEAVESLDSQVGAVRFRRYEDALAEARAATSDAPFAGVPILVKSVEPMAGAPGDMGSVYARRAGRMFAADSDVVRRLREAGFVPIGQSTTPELALASVTESRVDGVTRNPWDMERTPGGSSGGAAAAVSAGMVSVATGTDGGGSTRIPAAFCGLVGLKSSYGRLPVGPGNDQWHHSVPSVLTRSVRDTEAIVRCLTVREPVSSLGEPGTGPHDSSVPVRSLRIGFVTSPPGHVGEVHPDLAGAVESTAALLHRSGHHVEESHPAAFFDPQVVPMFFDALSVTVSQLVDQLVEEAGSPIAEDDFDIVTQHWDRRGRQIDGLSLANALTWQCEYRARMAQWWQGYDVLICPVFATPPPKLGWIWSEPDGIQKSVDVLAWTVPSNTTGQPSIAVPHGTTAEGLPIGVQLIGRFGDDELLLGLARHLEDLAPWDGVAPSFRDHKQGGAGSA